MAGKNDVERFQLVRERFRKFLLEAAKETKDARSLGGRRDLLKRLLTRKSFPLSLPRGFVIRRRISSANPHRTRQRLRLHVAYIIYHQSRPAGV